MKTPLFRAWHALLLWSLLLPLEPLAALPRVDRNGMLLPVAEEDAFTFARPRFSLSARMSDIMREWEEAHGPNAVSGVSTWTGGAGNWSDGSKWNPVDPPNSAAADVFVDGSNAVASTVSVDGNFTVGRLTIDAGDSVNILDNRTLAFTNTGGFTGAGSIVNNGNLLLTTQGNLTNLRIDSAVALSGSGTVTLTRDSSVTTSNNSRIAGNGTLTNSSTIQGEGRLGDNETAFVNQSGGIIQANVGGRSLSIDPNGVGGLSNAGILRATNGGTLSLTGNGGGDFINTASGSIQANGAGSEVQLNNSTRISGGTLSTSAGGIIRNLNSQTAFLDALTNAGNFIGNDNSTTALSGAIINTGDIRLFTQGNTTSLRIDGAVTLSGSGTVTLDRDSTVTASSSSRIAGSGTLTNSSTIQGEGNVGSNETGIINQAGGIIQANVGGLTLVLDPNSAPGMSNAGVLRAIGGSVLQLTGNGSGDFINTGSGSIQANGANSEVQLVNNARISGGTLSTSGGGVIRTLNSQTAFLDALTNSGTFIGNDNSSTVISGTINNTGDFTLSTDGNLTNLRIDTAATLAGSGTVTLTRNAAATAASNARIAGSGTLTNQSTIQGEGFVGANETTIVNQSGGIIQANVSTRVLQLDPVGGTGTFINQGLLRATNSGILQLTGNGGGTFNNAGGIIRAEAGSEVQLFNNVTITGGTLSTQGAGALLHTLNSNTVTLDNLTISGTYTGSDNSTTILTGAINNTGDITITTDGNFTNLRVDGSATLQSGGTVTLTRNAAVTAASNSRITGSGTLTNASTIQGEGNVGANELTVVNQSGGIIQANVLGRVLQLDSITGVNSFANSGVLRATDGGVLQFTGNGGGDFNNVGSGSIQANGTGSEVQLVNTAVIHGGTLSTSGGGVIRTINSNSATLDTLTNAGTFIGNDNSSTFLTGTITNTGDMTITSDGNFTDLRIDAAVTLNGSGTVSLTRNAAVTNASNARIRGPGTLTNNSTIQGEGFIGSNEMSIVNSTTGIIQANIAGRALVIDPSSVAGSYSNSGVFRATNGGILQLSGNGGGDFNNTGVGTIQAIGAGSEVQLINNATIRGGTLISSGGGLFRNPNSGTGTLDAVTNPGNFIGNDNSTTFLQNTINNTGDMTFTSDGNFTDVRIDGNTTLTGNGTITLTRNAAVTGASNVRIRGGGTLTNGTTIQGEGGVGANETTVINTAGGVIQANVSGRTLTLDPGSSATGLTNNAGGTLRASNGGTLNLTGNGGGTFTNNGTFEALDGSTLQMDGSAVLTNYNSAGQILSGGIFRAVSTGNASVLNLNIGQILSNAASIILDGANTIIHTSDNTTDALRDFNNNAVNGSFTITNGRNFDRTFAFSNQGLLTIGPGSLFTATQFDLTGTVTGVGTLTVSGPLNWAAGTMSGTGITNASGPLNISSTSDKFLDARTVNMAGTTTWSGNSTIAAGNGAVFNNLAVGTFNAQGALDKISFSGIGTAATFNNAGTFNESSFAGGTTVDAIFNNSGSVNVTQGFLTLQRGGTNTGSFVVSGGTQLTFSGGIHEFNSGASLNGNASGEVTFLLGTVNFSSGATYSSSGYTHIYGGTVNFNNVANGNITGLTAGGVLGGSGTYNSFGIFDWAGGTMSGLGTTNANGGLDLNNGTKTFVQRTLNNNGTATWSGGNISGGQGAIFNNPSGRTFTDSFDGNWLFNQGGSLTQFNNAGTFTKSAGSGTTLLQLAFANSGLLNANSGTLSFSQGVQGLTGTVTVASGATLNLTGGSNASSASILNVNGNLSLGANNFNVALDYTNANFGIGNSFNPRANVSGAGGINVTGNVNQTIAGNVTGGTAALPTMTFGNFHVGDGSVTKNYAINNIGSSGPSLRGAIQTSVNGGNITDGRLSGTGVTAGNWGPLGLGANTGNFAVTFNPSSAGALTGQIVHLINNFDNVQDQNVSITGAAFRLASASTHTPEPVSFGIVHIGETPSQAITISNTAANDGFSEKLDGSIAPTSGGVTASGSFSLLGPGAPPNTSLSVGINTATAGNKNGTATISLVSNGTGTSELAPTNLFSQTVNVTGQVNYFADPTLTLKTGSAPSVTLTMNSPTSFTLDFGMLMQNSGTYLASFGVQNLLHDSTFQDLLGGSFNTATVANFILSGFGSFSGIAPGGTLDPDVNFDTNRAVGVYTDILTLNPTSANASGTSNLNGIQLSLRAQVVPEPGTWALIAAGAGMLIAVRSFVRRRY